MRQYAGPTLGKIMKLLALTFYDTRCLISASPGKGTQIVKSPITEETLHPRSGKGAAGGGSAWLLGWRIEF